ncbi:MAG: hypothetical protein FJ253_12305, partial [Phycisphaerae bacterium]|nr:hypothetical protein [Phycisphaerae bacterium]
MMPIRAHAAAVACVLGGMLAGASRPAFGQMAPFPGPLEAMTLFEQIERRAPGALDLDAWFEIERCLEHADAQIAARFVPRLIELDRIATAQSWLNWPSIKPKAVRELRDHCVDLEIEIDREFFQCAIEALARRTRSSQATGAPGSAEEGAGGGAPDSVEDSPLVRAIRSVERRRIRELLPPWPLLDAAPVDLDRIAARQLAPLDLGDDARLAIARELESWEQSRATECLAQRASRRDAFDRFEALLLEQGVDLAELDDPGGAWMVAAFDAWSRVGESLEMSVRAMI